VYILVVHTCVYKFTHLSLHCVEELAENTLQQESIEGQDAVPPQSHSSESTE